LSTFSDENLMKSVRDGDPVKLGLLFERHHRHLYNYFMRWSKGSEASEDLVQDVFCRILKYKSSYKDEQAFLPWLFRIAHNAGVDHFHTKEEALPLDDSFEPVSNGQFEKKLDDRMALKHLSSAMEKLSPEKRELVLLCRFHNLKYKQISGILGCSISAIKVRLHRALKELADLYQGCSEEKRV